MGRLTSAVSAAILLVPHVIWLRSISFMVDHSFPDDHGLQGAASNPNGVSVCVCVCLCVYVCTCAWALEWQKDDSHDGSHISNPCRRQLMLTDKETTASSDMPMLPRRKRPKMDADSLESCSEAYKVQSVRSGSVGACWKQAAYWNMCSW